MSQAPGPKQNLMQTMLIMVVLFLGFNLFFGNRQPETRTSTEILANMRKLHGEIKDISIAAELPKLESRLRLEQEDKKVTPEQLEKATVEGLVLTADTQARAAKQRSDIDRATAAYMTMHGRLKQFQGKPLWRQEVKLQPHPQFPDTSTTPEKLYEHTVEDLSARNKQDMIFGLARGYEIIDFLVGLTGRAPGFSYAFAALLLAIIVRAVVWPLTQKQLMFSRQMMQLVPMTNELKTKFKGDPQKLQIETMNLYRSYGINPMAGCFPMALQLPLFIFVYQCMVHYRFEFRHGTFLWINPSTALSTGWTAPNLGEMDYPLLVIYGISMLVTTLLSPISNPDQVKQQRLMGIGMSLFVTIMMFFWPLPSAFVLYWICTNILSTIQSLRAYRLPVPPLVKVNAPHGAVFPTGETSNGAMTNGHTDVMFKRTGTPKTQKPKKKR